MITGNDVAQFWASVDKRGSRECWPWTGASNGGGYGSARFNGQRITAPRAAWVLAHGEIPAGMHVLHACDNPPCVNVAHLRLGTHADNMADKAERMRGRKVETLPPSEEIRRIYLAKGGDLIDTARELGVSRQTIWRHLRRARAVAPLRRGRGPAADRKAVEAFIERQLERVGVT